LTLFSEDLSDSILPFIEHESTDKGVSTFYGFYFYLSISIGLSLSFFNGHDYYDTLHMLEIYFSSFGFYFIISWLLDNKLDFLLFYENF
jgi:hypothetical protein